MTFWMWLRRSLRFYRRPHFYTALGAAVGTAVLTGALLVGDSVRWTLRRTALARLGEVRAALKGGERFFREELAAALQDDLRVPVVPAVKLGGRISRPDMETGFARATVYGVDERFRKLGGATGTFPADTADGVILNECAAAALNAMVGDPVVLRVEKPASFPREAPFSTKAGFSTTLRLRVTAVIGSKEFGNFNLRAEQVPPRNAFVSLRTLQEKIGCSGRANLLLLGGDRRAEVSVAAAGQALRSCFRLDDLGLELRRLPKQEAVELRSRRIFLPSEVARAALSPPLVGHGFLTYLVNELRAGKRATPYSLVTAAGPPFTPPDLRDDELVVNEWLAEDLAVKPGDAVTLTYFVLGPGRKLTARRTRFLVKKITPLQGAAADADLLPPFPGLTDAADCRDWEPGFPLDLDRIRDKDEKYWDDFRGTPKAFITLAAGRELWGNRFGDLTAVRWSAGENGTTLETVRRKLRGKIDPAACGLWFQPVRRQALRAVEKSLDYGELFLGLSFFLIAAALLLTALLFRFGLEARAEEVGTLTALGVPRRRVRRLFLGEAAVVALGGAAAGALGGVLCARLLLYALATVWRGAVAGAALSFHATPATLWRGVLFGGGAALAAMWWSLRGAFRRPLRELLAGGAEVSAATGDRCAGRSRGTWLGAVCVVAAGVVIFSAGAGRNPKAAAAFFAAGSLLLVGGLAFCAAFLARLALAAETKARPSLLGLSLRNAARRRERSLAVVGVLACGVFLAAAVGLNRRDPTHNAEKRWSATGGFAFLGETALPVLPDLNTPAGRRAFGLSAEEPHGVSFIQLRLREGDDASCLNLNRAQTPRLAGVRPEELAVRGAFVFAATLKPPPPGGPWRLLDEEFPDGATPVIADEATLTWGLGKSLGDDLTYTDEQGRGFKLRVVGILADSILQGTLLISEHNFTARFPSESGRRLFLIDAPRAGRPRTAAVLKRALADVGLELTPATRRAAELKTVENTYLSTFLVLGGLGLLLGTVGLGLVVLRNTAERRGEFALLRTVGFRRGTLILLPLIEHGALLTAGLGCGVVAALAAALPALRAPGADVPYAAATLLLFAVLLNGLFWTWAAARTTLREPLAAGLRNE